MLNFPSEDLEILDDSLNDPSVLIERKKTSNESLALSPCLEEHAPGVEEDNSVNEEREGELEGASEKVGTPQSFKTSLWSDKESAKSRTIDSWDFPVGPIAWDDNDKPIERLLSYADLTLTEEEENGLLTDRIVAACSSYLTRSPGTKYHVVAKVSLNNKNLNDIRILGYHRFLQYVDLSWNNLTDLTPLGCLPYLMYLDVSHNLMEEVLRFRPPLNLTYVNYSYNEVWQIDDLTDFWALCYLDLSHNKISKIQGLHNLRYADGMIFGGVAKNLKFSITSRYLRHLDLSHNQIGRFENLRHLRLTDLNLEYNLISKFEMERGYGLRTLPHLVNIYLNNNLITSLSFLEGAHTIKQLELQNNNISDLVELNHLSQTNNIRCLDLSGNPVSELEPYRSLVLNSLQKLKFLDQTEVRLSERAVACKKKTFEVQLEAARMNSRLILLENLNNPSLDLDVMPIDQGPYPFVILVGPPGSNKKILLSKLSEKYPEKIYLARLHTTREVLECEKNVLVHLDKEDFYDRIRAGKFLCVNDYLGQMFGFSRDELAEAVKRHKLCLTAMDMVSALTTHNYGIQPFLVLAIPECKEVHTERLKKIYGPILTVLGGAYIGQRDFATVQTPRTKQMSVILNNVLNDAMNIVDKSEAGAKSQLFHTNSGQSTKSVKNSAADKGDEVFPDDIAVEPICYKSSTGCFACTASKCGYQTSRMDKDYEKGQSVPEMAKSFSTTETDGSSILAETSYSASLLPEIKMDISISDASSMGEENLFEDWSMPFVDWSEVNLTSMEREEAAEFLCEKYIENVMSTRDTYHNLHLENPGLFSLTVYTDDVDKAAKEIAKFLKEVWRSTPQRKPLFDFSEDLVYQAYVPRKLETLKQILRNDFLSADGDTKCFSPPNPINNSLNICNEMHMKGYGDFVENL